MTGLAFDDDICLLAEYVDSIFALTETLNLEAINLSLLKNTQKNKVMEVLMNDGSSVAVEVENVDRFAYLGSTLCEDGDVE